MNGVPGRNDPCPCGSGKKYKHCCLGKGAARGVTGAAVLKRNAKGAEPTPVETNQLVALFSAGRFVELENLAHILVRKYADSGFAWKALGVSRLMQGKDAVFALERATKYLPDDPEAHYNLGLALKDLGRPDHAVKSYRRALKIKPDYAIAHCDLGLSLNELGQIESAVASYRRALEIKPDLAIANYNLGVALQDLGQLDDAVASYRRALETQPDLAQAHTNLGVVLQELAQNDDAVASYRRALQIKPDLAEAHRNLGTALQSLGQLAEAVASYRRALEINPDYAIAHNNLGVILHELGQLDGALVSYRRTLEINADYPEAHRNLGVVLQDLGQLEDAMANYRRALEIKPDYEAAFDNLLFALNYHPDKTAQEIFATYREFDELFGMPLRSTWRDHSNSRETVRRLKVGYVSPDFRLHSTRHFLEPLLANHDRGKVEVFAYAELAQEDAVTERYKGYADHWVPTRGMSNNILAERIRADSIDILVDLAGHTANNRLQAFARKPAPVSLSWLGYGYTTGLSAVDYLLTDEASSPEGSEGLFSETPWRLQTPGYAYRPARDMGPVGPLPAAQRGYITFGTLTRGVRINHRTVRVWSELLKRVTSSRLVVDSRDFRNAAVQDALAEKFAAYGIERPRLELGFHSPPWDVLRGIDIGLDCFPHNSGTTLFESLYMGVPYVSLAGRPSVGRLGGSILQGAGHPEWIAQTEEEYLEKAVAMAADLPRLALLRAGLRREIETSPLMDEARFARNVEGAYRAMFEKWAKE